MRPFQMLLELAASSAVEDRGQLSDQREAAQRLVHDSVEEGSLASRDHFHKSGSSLDTPPQGHDSDMQASPEDESEGASQSQLSDASMKGQRCRLVLQDTCWRPR